MTNAKQTLTKGEIHLWFTHPEKITDAALLDQYFNLLTNDEQTRQQRYKFAKDRHDALITRAFVRDVLSHYADINPKAWRFAKGEKDKPEIVNPPLPLRFNISHTEGLIACGVCLEDDLGVDVENTTRNNDVLAIADRYFSPTETQELFGLPEKLQEKRFFDYWTLKESYIKAVGLGLAIPLDSFSFEIKDHESFEAAFKTDIQLSFKPERNEQPELWQSWILYPNEKHRVSLSIKTAKPESRYKLRYFHSTPLISAKETDFPY